MKNVVIKWVGKQIRITLYENGKYEDDWLVDAVCWEGEDECKGEKIHTPWYPGGEVTDFS